MIILELMAIPPSSCMISLRALIAERTTSLSGSLMQLYSVSIMLFSEWNLPTVNKIRIKVAQLETSVDGGLLDIGIFILKHFENDGFDKVICSFKSKRAETSKSQTSDSTWFRLVTVFAEGVNGNDSQIRVVFGVVDQVEVDHLLGDEIRGVWKLSQDGLLCTSQRTENLHQYQGSYMRWLFW